jgi:hypothetical protein
MESGSDKDVRDLANSCVLLKQQFLQRNMTEAAFLPVLPRATGLQEAFGRVSSRSDLVAALLSSFEGNIERSVVAAYRVDGSDLHTVIEETGTPAGWLPLVAGYDASPAGLLSGMELPSASVEWLKGAPRRTLSGKQVVDLRRRLGMLYEAGPGTKVEEDDRAPLPESAEEEEGETATSEARIPVPSETFVGELAAKLEVHPVSVYWLLREVREKDGVVCKAELRRFIEDYVSVLVLRLLGHRWPRETESGDPAPAWTDLYGIVPITSAREEPTLLSRVRERLAEDFGPDRVAAVEQEFRDIVGASLEGWLAAEFFTRHISQFRKRPIAWQLRSLPTGNDVRGRGKGRKRGPSNSIFSCLVFYHRLDADLLPKLRTHYIGPVLRGFQTELGDLEKTKTRTTEQDARRLELVERVDELKAFDGKLEEVSLQAFACAVLEEIARAEGLDKWTSRDGRSPVPGSREAFLAQESRYDPDLNDGVRVNLAPLQRAGLLAADVLGAKDAEKSVADRAEWRADERRWCREGKLPQPGWWPGGATDTKASTAASNRGSGGRDCSR